MSPTPPKGSQAGRNQKGSVKRARQLLAAGVRPERVPVPSISDTQWPLPDAGLQPYPLNPHPGFRKPRGPPPQRPRRPSDVPSPSVYSPRTSQASDAVSASVYGRHSASVYTRRPAQSFSQPQPPPPLPVTNDDSGANAGWVDMTPHPSTAAEDLFRRSTASSSSIPEVPPFPPPPAPSLPPDDLRQRIAGLVRSASSRHAHRHRRSTVSPIAEELSDRRDTLPSMASSRAIQSSVGSGRAESGVLGEYLDDDYDSDYSGSSLHDDSTTLVRNASLGKRGKPTMRTILKPNPTSGEVSVPKTQTTESQKDSSKEAAAGAAATASTASSDSVKGVDTEKPPITHKDNQVYRAAYEKEIQGLTTAAPAMSDRRPHAPRPPSLNLNAVWAADRGSLSSLTDMIRRATQLASNLDQGRTASKADLMESVADFKAGFGHRRLSSGSLSDILASFPPPRLSTPEDLFGRPHLIAPFADNDDGSEGKARKRRGRRCGMPNWLFILLCIMLFLIALLAILLPIFLIVVPRVLSGSPQPSCSHTNPCHNGGVSVSSGIQCSCVCANGYTGSQCTIQSDGSCVTTQVSNSSTAENATMGSALPRLFKDSRQKFNIMLDSVTIMALFSKYNLSCTTENALVSFSEIDRRRSSGNRRRSPPAELLAALMPSGEEGSHDASPSISSTEPTPVLAARAMATATKNGIVYASSPPTQTPKTNAASTTTWSTAHSASQTSATSTPEITATASTATGVSKLAVEFSQIAVLFMFEKTGSLDAAMDTESRIQSYLVNSYMNNSSHVHLGRVELPYFYALDFVNMTITMSGGAVVGGL